MTEAYPENQTPYQILTTANAERLQNWSKAPDPGPTQTLARLALGIGIAPSLKPPFLYEVAAELDETSVVPASPAACELIERTCNIPINPDELTVAGFFKAVTGMLPAADNISKVSALVVMWTGGVSSHILAEAAQPPLKEEKYIVGRSVALATRTQANSYRSSHVRRAIEGVLREVAIPSPAANEVRSDRLQDLLTLVFGDTALSRRICEAPAFRQLKILEALFQRHRDRPLGHSRPRNSVRDVKYLWRYCMGVPQEETMVEMDEKSSAEFERPVDALASYLRTTSGKDLHAIDVFLEGKTEEIVLEPPKRPIRRLRPRLPGAVTSGISVRPMLQIDLVPPASSLSSPVAKQSVNQPAITMSQPLQASPEPATSSRLDPEKLSIRCRLVEKVLGEVADLLSLGQHARARLFEHANELTVEGAVEARRVGANILSFIPVARNNNMLSDLHFEVASRFFGTSTLAGKPLNRLAAIMAPRIEAAGVGSVEDYLCEFCDAWITHTTARRQNG